MFAQSRLGELIRKWERACVPEPAISKRCLHLSFGISKLYTFDLGLLRIVKRVVMSSEDRYTLPSQKNAG